MQQECLIPGKTSSKHSIIREANLRIPPAKRGKPECFSATSTPAKECPARVARSCWLPHFSPVAAQPRVLAAAPRLALRTRWRMLAAANCREALPCAQYRRFTAYWPEHQHHAEHAPVNTGYFKNTFAYFTIAQRVCKARHCLHQTLTTCRFLQKTAKHRLLYAYAKHRMAFSRQRA